MVLVSVQWQYRLVGECFVILYYQSFPGLGAGREVQYTHKQYLESDTINMEEVTGTIEETLASIMKRLNLSENRTDEIAKEADKFFLIVMSIVIFFMQCGFAFLEAGSVRWGWNCIEFPCYFD